MARNDLHQIKVPISLIVNGGIPGWAIALIVIAAVLVASAIGYFVYAKFLKKAPYRESET